MKINDVLVEGPVLQAKKPAQQPDEMGRVEPTMNPQAQVQQPAQQPAPAQQQAQPAPQQPAPVQQAQQPAQAAQTAQQKATVGQINKAIPGLRTRDLQSVKKTVDTTIAQKSKQPAPAQQQAQPAQEPAPQQQAQQDNNPYQSSRVDLTGYEVNQHGKLVKKNPGFFGSMKNAVKGMVQGAQPGAKVDPNAPWFQGYKGQAYNAPTYQDKIDQERAAVLGKQQPGTVPQSASAIAQGMRTSQPKQAKQPKQTQAPQQPSTNLAQGVQVVNQEPIVLRYQGKDFGLNDQGQWVSQKTGKAPAQAMQQFLSQQHDASLNV